MSSSIGDFKTEMTKVLKPTRYEIEFSGPGWQKALGESGLQQNYGQLLSMRCEQVSFPGSNIASQPYKLGGPIREMPYERMYTGDLGVTFRLGSQMEERKFFKKWQDIIVSPETGNLAYYNEYICDINIYQLDEDDNRVYGIRIEECWPKIIEEISLGYDQNDTYQKQAISFAYRRWVELDISATSSGMMGPMEGGIPFNLPGQGEFAPMDGWQGIPFAMPPEGGLDLGGAGLPMNLPGQGGLNFPTGGLPMNLPAGLGDNIGSGLPLNLPGQGGLNFPTGGLPMNLPAGLGDNLGGGLPLNLPGGLGDNIGGGLPFSFPGNLNFQPMAGGNPFAGSGLQLPFGGLNLNSDGFDATASSPFGGLNLNNNGFNSGMFTLPGPLNSFVNLSGGGNSPFNISGGLNGFQSGF
jgi:hypothetical protein